MNELLRLMLPSKTDGHSRRNDGITKDVTSPHQILSYFYPLEIIVAKSINLNWLNQHPII